LKVMSGGGDFLEFCIEMAYFGAKVTNGVAYIIIGFRKVTANSLT